MSSKKQKIDLNESSSGMLNGDNFNENGCQNEANLDNYHESGKLICRDFQRKNCFRGMSCRFLHVEESQESSLNHNNCNNNNNNSNNNHHGNSNPNNNNNNNNNGSNNNSNNHHNNSNSNNGKNLPLATMFCRDFQASKCTRNSCKFIHCTRQDEMRYRKTGRLPTDSQFEGSILGVMPVCKDYLNNACFRSNCKFRHSSSSNSSDRSQNSSEMNSHHAMPELNGGYGQHPQQQQQQQQPFLLPQSHQRPHSMHPMMFHPNGHYPMEPNLYPHDHHQSNGVDGGRKRKLRQFEGNIDYNGYNHYDLQLLWETQEENRQLRKSLEDCQNRVAEITKNLDFVMEQFTRVQSGQATVITPAAAVAVAAQVATSVSASLHSAPASVGTISTTTFPTALSLSTPIGVQPPPPIMAPTVLAALPPPPPPSIVSSISAIPLPTVSSIATIPLPTVSQAMNLGNSSATLVNYTTTTVWPHNVEQ